MADDPYVALGVDPSATDAELHRAWLALARRHHPDRGGDAARMQQVNEAWAVLGDPARRRAWDREHGTAHGSRTTHEPVDDAAEEGFDDDDLDLLDPRPLVPSRRSPVDLLPVVLFAVSVATACLGLALDAPAMLGFAAFLFFLSCLAVGAVAMLSMRRGVRAGHR